jgi:hypothetical protein
MICSSASNAGYLALEFADIASIMALRISTPDKRGGFNESMQHSTRIHKALKTNAKIAR